VCASGLVTYPSIVFMYHVGFEVFTAVVIKNAVFWKVKTQFVPHRRNIASQLQSPAG
jgi:hypothetical protein